MIFAIWRRTMVLKLYLSAWFQSNGGIQDSVTRFPGNFMHFMQAALILTNKFNGFIIKFKMWLMPDPPPHPKI